MRICLVSFDFWNYDNYIVQNLQKQGITATHINLRHYKHRYPTFFHRIKNFFGKTFRNINIKKVKREEYILNELEKLGKQEQILVINPEVISVKTHQKIKAFTDRYIAYLYDSSKRNPVEHLLHRDLFEKIFSFDLEDVQTYNLEHLTNYNYWKDKPSPNTATAEYDLFTISSIDERLEKLERIVTSLKTTKISFLFLLIGKRKPANLHEKIQFSTQKKTQTEVRTYMEKSKAVLDLLREDQTGLSFRVFEAMALQKKLVTSNIHIKQYDFYDPNNILVINPENPEIHESFFATDYKSLPEKIYRKYTLDAWVNRVFELN